jgi:hypothetical protein
LGQGDRVVPARGGVAPGLGFLSSSGLRDKQSVGILGGTMTYAQRLSGQRRDRRTAARLLIAAALMLGLFAMHGLTMPPMSMTAAAMPTSASSAVADVATIGVAAAALHPVEHAAAAVMAAFADIGMPMPGGHPGHGVMDLCLAILAGLAALALLAAALARRHSSVMSARSATRPTDRVHVWRARRRLAPSITTLCVSRT